MADPLATAAETMVPSRPSTRFFDPMQSADVLSRYAVQKRVAEASDEEFKSASNLTRSRIDLAQERQQLKTWDRADAEHEEKQAYKRDRGRFLKELAGLNPTDPDFVRKRNAVLETLPMEIRDDDAATAIIAALDDEHKSQTRYDEREKATQTRINQQFELAGAKQENDAVKYAGKAGLSVPEMEAFRDPETGQLDVAGLYFTAGEKSRALAKAKDENRAAAYAALRGKNVRLPQAAEVLVATPGAFASKLGLLMQQTKLGEDILKSKYPGEYAAAVEFDKDKLNSEAAIARSEPSADEFVAMGGKNLDSKQREARRQFWQTVHDTFGKAGAPTAPAPAAPAPAAPAIPKAGDIMKGYRFKGGDPSQQSNWEKV